MLKVEYVPKDSLRMYENNAKEHPAEQIEQIKKSIKEFGFNDPIAVWNDTIVEGHGRLLAADELGLEEVPIIRLDHLTDEQRRAYTLVHNKLTMNSGFDLVALAEELDSITNFDMGEYGFIIEVPEEIKAIEEEKPEIPFTEVLKEEHNYVVLYFDNEVDWLQACSLLDISTKRKLSTRKDGVITKSFSKRYGIGRVINGSDAFEKLRRAYEN